MEIKTEADSTACPHYDQPTTGMSSFFDMYSLHSFVTLTLLSSY